MPPGKLGTKRDDPSAEQRLAPVRLYRPETSSYHRFKGCWPQGWGKTGGGLDCAGIDCGGLAEFAAGSACLELARLG